METTWDGLPVAREAPFACCVVVWRRRGDEREFLLLHRLAPGGPGFAGDWAWTPPSGARQPGEEPDAAAARELHEETGLRLAFVPVPDVSQDVRLYVAEAPADVEVVLEAEHDEFRWLPLAEAVAMCLPAAVGDCLRAAAAASPGVGYRGSEFLEAVSSDGLRVLEAELGDAGPELWVERARERGAELLWLHGGDDLTRLGFERFPGYVRLHAATVPAGEPLPELDPGRFVDTLDRAYRGLWGHKQVTPDATPPAGAIVLGLHERGEPIGLCTVFPDGRLVDGPGLASEARAPDAYVRLLRGACAALGEGPAGVDSWGDDPAVIEAYESLGFAIVERVAGWQLRLA